VSSKQTTNNKQQYQQKRCCEAWEVRVERVLVLVVLCYTTTAVARESSGESWALEVDLFWWTIFRLNGGRDQKAKGKEADIDWVLSTEHWVLHGLEDNNAGLVMSNRAARGTNSVQRWPIGRRSQDRCCLLLRAPGYCESTTDDVAGMHRALLANRNSKKLVAVLKAMGWIRSNGSMVWDGIIFSDGTLNYFEAPSGLWRLQVGIIWIWRDVYQWTRLDATRAKRSCPMNLQYQPCGMSTPRCGCDWAAPLSGIRL